jgi:UDP-GlcNAc3NAcA epimerase
LKAEGYDNFDCEVIKSGDVMYDAALYYKKKAQSTSTILADNNIESGNYILATIHRQENTDYKPNLAGIVEALNEVNANTKVIVPLHPRTKKIIADSGLSIDFAVIDPVGYIDMVQLTANAKLIMTDSGGLQKEAFFFGKNCVTMREQTEWVELVNHGFNITTGAVKDSIVNAYKIMLNKQNNFDVNLYGTGNAAEEILEGLQ